jgi:hypothetical protein
MLKPVVTNADRAAWAEEALATFVRRVHRNAMPHEMNPVEREDAIADLITDLLHLALRESNAHEAATPNQLLERAGAMFLTECIEDP